MITTGTGKGESQENVINEFIKELEETAKQVHKLLEDINDSKVDFAEIKTELRILVNDVKHLSGLVRDGDNGAGILTRIALIEKNIDDLKLYVEKDATDDVQLVTKIALLEQSLDKMNSLVPVIFKKIEKIETRSQNIDTRLVKLEEEKKAKEDKEKNDNELAVIDQTGKWKLYSVIATGAISLIVAITTLVIKLFFG